MRWAGSSTGAGATRDRVARADSRNSERSSRVMEGGNVADENWEVYNPASRTLVVFLDGGRGAAIIKRPMMGTFVKVASVNDVAPGTAKRVEAGGKEIAIFNV